MKNTIQAIRIGNTVNCFINGKLYKKTFSETKDADTLFDYVMKHNINPTKDDIDFVLSLMNDNLRIALKCGLETDPNTGKVYLAGFNTPVPKTLINIFEEYHEKGYPLTMLENFWQLLMLNEDKRNRERAFDFITQHDFVVTNKGYMVTYKAVYVKENGNDVDKQKRILEYVADKYDTIKHKWKKSPKKYFVYEDNGEYHITHNPKMWDDKIIGSLHDLYKNGLNGIKFDDKEPETVYTDMYSKSMTIKLGEPVRMERGSCDADPSKDCSYGLHVGATKYVENFATNNSVILVCLVNPANIVAVPNYDHSKMRVSEYFPIGVAERDSRGNIQIIDQPFYEDDYVSYEQEELVKLLEKVRNEEPLRETPKNGEEETRDMSELQKIIEERIIMIS